MKIENAAEFLQKSSQTTPATFRNISKVRYVATFKLGEEPSMKLKVTDDKKCYTWKATHMNGFKTCIAMNRTWMERLQKRRKQKKDKLMKNKRKKNVTPPPPATTTNTINDNSNNNSSSSSSSSKNSNIKKSKKSK